MDIGVATLDGIFAGQVLDDDEWDCPVCHEPLHEAYPPMAVVLMGSAGQYVHFMFSCDNCPFFYWKAVVVDYESSEY